METAHAEKEIVPVTLPKKKNLRFQERYYLRKLAAAIQPSRPCERTCGGTLHWLVSPENKGGKSAVCAGLKSVDLIFKATYLSISASNCFLQRSHLRIEANDFILELPVGGIFKALPV